MVKTLHCGILIISRLQYFLNFLFFSLSSARGCEKRERKKTENLCQLMWQQAGLIPGRPPVYHRLEKQPQHIYGQFWATREPSFACLRIVGRKQETSHTATGRACIKKKKKKKRKTSHRKRLQKGPAFCERDVSKLLSPTGSQTSLPKSHVVPVAARWPSPNKGATVDLRRERVINLSEGREDQTSTHMAKAVTQANLLGWSTYSFFSHWAQPPPPFLCVGCNTATAPTEKSSIFGVAALSQPVLMRSHRVHSVAAIADECASVRAANLSHMKRIPAEGTKGTFRQRN